jgi:hypothetical protein
MRRALLASSLLIAACAYDVVLARRDGAIDSAADTGPSPDGGVTCDPVDPARDCYVAPDFSQCMGQIASSGAPWTLCSTRHGSGTDGIFCTDWLDCATGYVCWLDPGETSGACWRPCAAEADCQAPNHCDVGGRSTDVGRILYRCIP